MLINIFRYLTIDGDAFNKAKPASKVADFLPFNSHKIIKSYSSFEGLVFQYLGDLLKKNKTKAALETRNQRSKIRDKREELSKRDTIMTKQKYDFD